MEKTFKWGVAALALAWALAVLLAVLGFGGWFLWLVGSGLWRSCRHEWLVPVLVVGAFWLGYKAYESMDNNGWPWGP